MAGGMSFSFPSLLFHEGRTYGQPEVVESSGKSNHKTTKHVIAKDTKHLWVIRRMVLCRS